MRIDNVKITIEIPIYFGQPDRNGYVYSKESWEKAIKNAVNVPIEIINDDGTRTVVGIAQDVKLIKDSRISLEFLEYYFMVELLKMLNSLKMSLLM